MSETTKAAKPRRRRTPSATTPRSAKKRGSAAAKKAVATRRARGSAKGGRRPALLDPKVRKTILDVIRAGNYSYVAAAYAGVGRSTYWAWLQRARNERARRDALRSEGITDLESVDPERFATERPYVEFLEQVEEAEAAGEVRLVTTLAALTGPQHEGHVRERAARTLLERRYRNNWGRSERHDVVIGGDADRPVTVRIEQEQQQRTESILAVLVDVGALPGGVASPPALESGTHPDGEEA